jgi:ERCC4-type nuclease
MSDFVPIPNDVEDLDVVDFTNENADGMVEFKSFSDLMGSTTGNGVYHLHEQAVKMYATGIPAAIIVYGNRTAFQKRSNVADEFILRGLQKALSVIATYKIAFIMAKDENEAIELAKTFIRNCVKLPTRLPVYNFVKRTRDEGRAVLCGFTKIGPKTADNILKKWRTLFAFFSNFFDLVRKVGKDKAPIEMHKRTSGLGNVSARRILEGLFRMYIPEED